MSISNELARLGDLHQQGRLSDDEYARAKARVLDNGSPVGGRMQRSEDDRWLGGVCGGLAAWTGVASWIWRLGFVLAVLCAGTGIAIYLLLWLFVPVRVQAHRPALEG
jgi:phage shock protein PspC (stress-responsive transcriptional regulator)